MQFQDNIGTLTVAELAAAAPAVNPQNIILKRQFFVRVCVVVYPTWGEVISK